jgi:hypothetical protein
LLVVVVEVCDDWSLDGVDVWATAVNVKATATASSSSNLFIVLSLPVFRLFTRIPCDVDAELSWRVGCLSKR